MRKLQRKSGSAGVFGVRFPSSFSQEEEEIISISDHVSVLAGY